MKFYMQNKKYTLRRGKKLSISCTGTVPACLVFVFTINIEHPFNDIYAENIITHEAGSSVIFEILLINYLH